MNILGRTFSAFVVALCGIASIKAQVTNVSDTVIINSKVSTINGKMHYKIRDGKYLVYDKPVKFAFIKNLPRDAGGIFNTTFKKESIKPLLLIAGTTTLFLFTDQNITDGFREFADKIHLHPEEQNKNVLNFNLGSTPVSVLRLPTNINTAFYQLGQGFPSLVIGAGLYAYGKIHDDYRALSTASQLAEAFILMGVGSQVMKRITGRQSPSEANVRGGNWHFFPSFSEYQNHTPNYDAFPSGHLATLMSTVTIFTENYPEKKWIKPVGYSLSGLVALSMINNKVHWASDYPLAIGLGYLCAKQVAKRSRAVVNPTAARKKKGELNYTFNYQNGVLMPGATYNF